MRILYPARSFSWIHSGMAVLFLCFAVPAFAQSSTSQSPAPAIGPIVRQSVHHAVSPALRDLPTINESQLTVGGQEEAEPVRRIPWSPSVQAPMRAESVLQTTAAAPSPEVAISVNQNFEGLGNAQNNFTVRGAPPDTNGAVGLTKYVQWVNTSFAVFDKSTGALVNGPFFGNQLWNGFGGGCQNNNNGDPIVVYDKLADRWVLSQFSVTGGPPFLQCVAVSTGNDPAGSYNLYSFQYSNFDDYPKMGAWSDAYYVTFNMFNNANTFVGADLCAYDRNAMLSGALTATQVCFQPGTSFGAFLASDFDGTTPPPAGSPNFMVFGNDLSSLGLLKFHVDFVTPANSTLTGPTIIPVSPFSILCGGSTCVPQPGTTQQLDSLADRLMYRLAYRNFGDHESLVVTHSVVAGAGGGVRWYELQNPNGAVTVAQQSTFAPDSSFRWMPSIAMDKAGDIAIGYSLSSSSVNPSIAVTGRSFSDPANTMQAENIMQSGGGSQTSSIRSLSRWGDYSAMQIDPADDCTFWFTTEYMKTTGVFNWNTRIMSFKFPGCGAPPHVTGLSFNPSTVASGVSSTGTVTLDIAAPSPGATVALSSDKNIVQVPANVVVPTGQTIATFNTPTTPTPALTVATVTGTLNLSSQQGTLTVNQSASPVLLVHRTGNVLGTVTSGDGFINCGTTCSAAYGSPATVVLTATPAAGSTFTGWSGVGGCPGTGTCSVSVSTSQTVTASFVGGLGFIPITPCRVVDTRNPNGPFGGPFLAGQASRGFTIPSGACSIPGNAAAYSLNVTVVPHTGLGFLTMYPCGQSVPGSSTLNSDGRVKAVGAIVPAGTSGAVCAFTTHDTELILDINGYFIPSNDVSSPLHFYPVTPCRLVDTRNAAGALGGPALVGQATRTFPLRTACGLPPTVQAYSLNVTAVPTNGIGFLTAWPGGQAQPSPASTLNAPLGNLAVANAAIVPAGTNGNVSVFTTHDTHLIIDVNGYFAAQSNTGLSLFTLPPCRIIDTRLPNGNPPLNGQLDVNVFASSCGAAATAKAYVLSATVVPPGLLGFLTLWQQGVTEPTASTLNSFDGVVYSNMAITPTTNGYVSAFTSSPSHLILDISAYFAGVQTSAPTLQGLQTTTAAGVVAPNQPTAPAKDDK